MGRIPDAGHDARAPVGNISSMTGIMLSFAGIALASIPFVWTMMHDYQRRLAQRDQVFDQQAADPQSSNVSKVLDYYRN